MQLSEVGDNNLSHSWIQRWNDWLKTQIMSNVLKKNNIYLKMSGHMFMVFFFSFTDFCH